MKKIIIISSVAAVIVIIIGAVLYFTNMFTKGDITGKLYRVDNVYEEIYNMVNSEKNGNQTVLTTSIDDSYVDYDFGFFENVMIPVNEEYKVVLSFNYDELCIWVFDKNNKADDALYVYNYQENILYGNREESFLIDNFISLYYSWVGNDGKFNPENQGDYTYEFAKYPLTHD